MHAAAAADAHKAALTERLGNYERSTAEAIAEANDLRDKLQHAAAASSDAALSHSKEVAQLREELEAALRSASADGAAQAKQLADARSAAEELRKLTPDQPPVRCALVCWEGEYPEAEKYTWDPFTRENMRRAAGAGEIHRRRWPRAP